jgi:translation initiation factor IF-2
VTEKVRVYELSRETGLSNKEVLRRLNDLGVDAATHSSSITDYEARRFLDSLGRKDAEQEEAERRRAEEAKRLAEIDLESVGAPEQRKARKVLPPHLRAQQEAEEAAAAVAEGVAAQEAESAAAAATGAEPTVETQQDERPAAAAQEAPAAAEETAEEAPSAPRMPGAPPPPPRPGEDASRPTPSGVRMPGAPPPPTVTGRTPQPRRVHEPKLPQEGSGRRSIPPPLRPAPERRPRPPGAPGQPGQGRGAPGRPGAPSRGDSPYRRAPGRGAPTGAPGGQPGGPGGKPGGGPGAGAPPRSAPGRGAPTGKTKRKKKRRQEEHGLEQGPQARRDEPLSTDVERVDVVSGVTVDELANKLGVSGASIVKMLFGMGEMVTVQQSLPDDTVEIICAELGVEANFVTEEQLEFGVEEPDDAEDLEPRPPVVTVMGHVDHGKTLLLDKIRETDVVSREAGGITQHIGAYQVSREGRAVTFIDTPGHAAFTSMRARGAQVTDIAVLVVAADDGVMPQTVEAINHAKAAEVPIVVAINKIDRPDAQPDRVKTQLTEHELVAEEFGGETAMVQVSAMTGENLDELIEIILLQAEIMELKANPNKAARGRVVEAHLDKGRGPVATVLVQGGTLNVGDVFVAGVADGKVRAMFDEHGTSVKKAGPAQPVLILGWNDTPEAGDEFRAVREERVARDIAERRAERARRKELVEQARPKTLEDLAAEVERGDVATLNLIIKGDVSGSVEALEDALTKLEIPEVEVRVVHKGVGAVTANDVALAEASDATIVAFNVRPDANARDAIEETGVDMRSYRIIYEAIEDIELAVKGLLAPEFQEVTLGEAEVREVFKVPRSGFVFGCMVTSGEVRRDATVRVVREGVIVAEDKIDSLRRFKDDVREVSTGYECGIGLRNFQDVKVGDVLEAFEQREVERV